MIAQLSRNYIKAKPTKVISRLISFLFFEGKPLTTKAQFINPFLLFTFKIISLLPQLRKIKTPIFIIGMGRSGTTILGQILSLHKDLGFLNEPKAMWYFANPLDDLIGSYSDEDARYIMNENYATADVSKKIHKLYAFYLSVIFSKRILDKYPEMIFRVPYLRKLFPDAKFLFIYRNGIDASISSSNWSEKNHDVTKSKQLHNWWGKENRKWKFLMNQVVPLDSELGSHANNMVNISNHIDKSMVEWICTMNFGKHLQNSFDSDILPIKYESFVKDPENALHHIFNFCHLKSDKKVIQYAKDILFESPGKTSNSSDSIIKEAFNNTMSKYNYTI